LEEFISSVPKQKMPVVRQKSLRRLAPSNSTTIMPGKMALAADARVIFPLQPKNRAMARS
jgi:hypothetical protein